MAEKIEQTDFFAKLEPAKEVGKNKHRGEEASPTPASAKKNLKKTRQDANIPAGGKLGGWQSRYDDNANDPNVDKKWKS